MRVSDMLRRLKAIKTEKSTVAVPRTPGAEWVTPTFVCEVEYAECAEFAPQIHRECIVAVDRGGTWRDFVGGERFDSGTQHVGRLAEIEIQAGQAVRP